jgi:hypothetical protein
MNILKMARDGLRRDLTVQAVGASSSAPTSPTPLFLVAFAEAAAEPQRPAKSVLVDAASDAGEVSTDSAARLAALKKELRAKEDFLQTTIEELATVNATGKAYAVVTTERTRRQQEDHDA